MLSLYDNAVTRSAYLDI